MRISTHILDTARGKPAAGVCVRLARRAPSGSWTVIASAFTDQDGRCAQLLPDGEKLLEGEYRLDFDTAGYFSAHRINGLYPAVKIAFYVRAGETHFHIPLLLSPNGYTTYRGS
jgi:5-hydroxyisourate hydrolase